MRTLNQLPGDASLKQARIRLENDITAHPTNADLRTALAQLLCLSGDWSRALTQLKSWLALARGQLRTIAASIDDSVTAQIVARCTEVESGGRMVDAILTNTLLPQMSRQLLSAGTRDEKYRHLPITFEQDAFQCLFTA
jgi:protein involved in temperature-dependent protein secretion